MSWKQSENDFEHFGSMKEGGMRRLQLRRLLGQRESLRSTREASLEGLEILGNLAVIFLPYLFLLSYLNQEHRAYGFQMDYQRLLVIIYVLRNVTGNNGYKGDVREYVRVRMNIMVLYLQPQDHYPYLSAEVFFDLYYHDLEARHLHLREHHRQQKHQQWRR